jgi:hypothetical protein
MTKRTPVRSAAARFPRALPRTDADYSHNEDRARELADAFFNFSKGTIWPVHRPSVVGFVLVFSAL